ncbi:MAG: hypothetical protein H2065_05070 [Candidatus Poseidoniales archaeon]|nr:hypothetical protein [Candidatus Poseidoniales archaeon]
MVEEAIRLVRPGLHQPKRGRLAVFLIVVLLVPIFQPVQADASVERDDFDLMETFSNLMELQESSDDTVIAAGSSASSLALVESSKRDSREGDPLNDSTEYLSQAQLRDTSPFEPDHPRPYEILLDTSTQPEGWPNNLVQTLFSLDSWDITDPLAVGINTYALYINFSSRDNGPQYEAWEYGTFTGELFVGTNLVLFENYIDIDGDSVDDVSISLTVLGLLTLNEGFGFEPPLNPLNPLNIPDTLWLRPTFQWKVDYLNENDPIWDELAHMEVSLLKGLAFDSAIQDSQSYALVLDTSLTQPPNNFRVEVGIQEFRFSISNTIGNAFSQLTDFLTGGALPADALSLTSVSAPYSISIRNTNSDSENKQTECDESYYDVFNDHSSVSENHKCGYGIGIGFIQFDQVDQQGQAEIIDMGYLDVGFHPEYGSNVLPEEVDLVLRNDNLGDNTFDTVELYSDVGADLWLHYFEDRSNTLEGSSFGNTTDSRLWIRGIPSGTLPQEEINAIFTMIGEAPGSSNLPGEVPDRLSFILAIKNFSGDVTANENDLTLPVNPAAPPSTLIMVAGTERIDSLTYDSTMKRGGYENDVSSLSIHVENLPEVLILKGSFQLSSTGLSRVNFNNPDLNTIAQLLDNALLTLVEIVLDLGSILNTLPDLIVGTAGSSGGQLEVLCLSQVRQTWSNGAVRGPSSLGRISMAIGSSDHPYISDSDHILLSQDTEIELVDGRDGPIEPIVPVAMSIRVSNISRVFQSYDPVTSVRSLELEGQQSGGLLVGHIRHSGSNFENVTAQSAMISNRPAFLSVVQDPAKLVYSASEPIGTITYGGEQGAQRNAIRLEGLPAEFQLNLGDDVGFQAETPITSIMVQMTNATTPLTMDGDHFRFWVDADSAQASLSAKISNVQSVQRYSPIDPNSTGPEGSARYALQRQVSAPFSISMEDVSNYEDPFLGLNGMMRLEPLPANLEILLPSDLDSSGLEIPDFSQGEGVEALSFFLGDVVGIGGLVNDLVYGLVSNVGDTTGETEDVAYELDMTTGESFDIVADMRKGSVPVGEPAWQHGLDMQATERTVLDFNLTKLANLTESSRLVIDDILADYIIDIDEREQLKTTFSQTNLSFAYPLIEFLEDGIITEKELIGVDVELLENLGVTFEKRRSWHLRTWLPQLPSGKIEISYIFSMEDEIPTYDFKMNLEEWLPAQERLYITMSGIEQSTAELQIFGFDTDATRDVYVSAVFTRQDNLTVPRLSIAMEYDVGQSLDYAYAVFVDHENLVRAETFIDTVPQRTEFSATIGDVLILTVDVPQDPNKGETSVESMMILQHRFVDGFWWPATTFFRDIPSQMFLSAKPDTRYDIREETSFQGMMTLDYASNSDKMDMYIEAHGRAIDAKGDTLMMAKNLPKTFKLETTEDWGVRIVSSDNGVEELYMRQSNVPAAPGVVLERLEIIGEDLKGATITIHRPFGYPVIILDDITTGRLVSSAEVYIEPGVYAPLFGGLEVDGRGVLLDAQFTGVIPTSTSIGINGVVTDLSVVSTLTANSVETRHIMVVEPFTSGIASLFAMIFG